MDRWSLHGPARFLDSVLDAVRSSSNVVIATSCNAVPDLIDTLESRIAEFDHTRVLDALEWDDPVDEIHAALDLPYDAVMSRTAASLMKRFERRRVIFVDVEGTRPWTAWKAFLGEYESACRGVLAMERTLFVVRVSGVPKTDLPKRAPALEVFSWSGHLSESDVLSYSLEKLRRHHHRVDRKVKLHARIINKIGAWDLDLVDHLLARPWDDLFSPSDALASIAGDGAALPKGIQWEEGGVCELDGEHVRHALSLWQRGDPDHELRMRLWAAQASELLPLLEIKRRDLAARIKRTQKVPPTARVFDEVISDIRDVEIGGLLHLSRKFGLPPDILKSAERLREYRNKLAHLTPLSADEVLQLLG